MKISYQYVQTTCSTLLSLWRTTSTVLPSYSYPIIMFHKLLLQYITCNPLLPPESYFYHPEVFKLLHLSRSHSWSYDLQILLTLLSWSLYPHVPIQTLLLLLRPINSCFNPDPTSTSLKSSSSSRSCLYSIPSLKTYKTPTPIILSFWSLQACGTISILLLTPIFLSPRVLRDPAGLEIW